MIVPILQTPDPRLLQPSEPCVVGKTALGDLIGNLIDTRMHARGVGLSAVQIGVHLRVVCINPSMFQGFSILINPEIVRRGGDTVVDQEGCLSIGNGRTYFPVRRHRIVTVKFIDRSAQEHTIVARGFEARIAQHEIDHLDGKMIP